MLNCCAGVLPVLAVPVVPPMAPSFAACGLGPVTVVLWCAVSGAVDVSEVAGNPAGAEKGLTLEGESGCAPPLSLVATPLELAATPLELAAPLALDSELRRRALFAASEGSVDERRRL